MASSTFPSSRDASHLSQQLRCSSSSTKHRRVLSSSSKAVRCKLLHKLGITPKSTTHHHHSSTTRTSREYLRNVPRYKQPLKYTHDHRCRRLSLEDREEEREPTTTTTRRSSTTQYRSSTSISSSPQRVILSDDVIDKLRNEFNNIFLDDERQQHPSPTHRRQSSPKCVSSFPVTMMEEGDRKKKKRRSVGFQDTVTVVPIPMRNEYSDRIKVKIWGDKVQTIEALERNILEYASEDYNWRNVCLEEEMYTCATSQELIHPVHLETGKYTFGTGGRCQRSYRYEC